METSTKQSIKASELLRATEMTDGGETCRKHRALSLKTRAYAKDTKLDAAAVAHGLGNMALASEEGMAPAPEQVGKDVPRALGSIDA